MIVGGVSLEGNFMFAWWQAYEILKVPEKKARRPASDFYHTAKKRTPSHKSPPNYELSSSRIQTLESTQAPVSEYWSVRAADYLYESKYPLTYEAFVEEGEKEWESAFMQSVWNWTVGGWVGKKSYHLAYRFPYAAAGLMYAAGAGIAVHDAGVLIDKWSNPQKQFMMQGVPLGTGSW